jgi:dTMP kinase
LSDLPTQTNRGAFISFEGIDGCGKTTQLGRIAERLRASGRDVVQTVEPGGTVAGRAIRRILLDPEHRNLDARAELLLYFASRAQNVAEVIEPSLERGATVLSDRFTDSTIVYQGAGRNLGPEPILELHRIACGDLWPDLTILLDIDLDASLHRARERTGRDGTNETRLEDEDGAFFTRVRDGYLRLAKANPERIVVVDGRAPVEEVTERIWEVICAHV